MLGAGFSYPSVCTPVLLNMALACGPKQVALQTYNQPAERSLPINRTEASRHEH